MLRPVLRFVLLTLLFCAPLLAVGQVRAGNDRFIGGTHSYSNGSGLVLAIAVQRR